MTTPADVSYRERLLGLLGDRPPLESLAASLAHIAAEAARLGPSGLRRTWGEGKWTGAQILAHLADAETATAFRIRQILSQDGHVIQPYDESAWARNWTTIDADAALACFRALRAWNLTLLRQLRPDQMERPIIHPERGRDTLDGFVRTLAGHDLNHLAQLRQISST
jgi:hypothetical protein